MCCWSGFCNARADEQSHEKPPAAPGAEPRGVDRRAGDVDYAAKLGRLHARHARLNNGLTREHMHFKCARKIFWRRAHNWASRGTARVVHHNVHRAVRANMVTHRLGHRAPIRIIHHQYSMFLRRTIDQRQLRQHLLKYRAITPNNRDRRARLRQRMRARTANALRGAANKSVFARQRNRLRNFLRVQVHS